jgi:hypothetical protein
MPPVVPWNASLQRTSCYASRQQARKVVLFSHLPESPSIPRFIPIEEVVAVKVTAQEIAQYGCFLWLSSNLSYT